MINYLIEILKNKDVKWLKEPDLLSLMRVTLVIGVFYARVLCLLRFIPLSSNPLEFWSTLVLFCAIAVEKSDASLIFFSL